MVDGKILLEKLLVYAKSFLGLSERDEPYFRNLLLREFKLSRPLEDKVSFEKIKTLDVPDSLVTEIEQYAVENGIVPEEEKALYSTYIMGILSPLPSVVEAEFYRLKEEKGVEKACEYFYSLCVKNNYVQKTAVSRNQKWEYNDGDKRLEITINLSKPEKDNKQTAKLLTANKSEKYPSCMICKENEGFKGTLSLPARQNLRTVSVNLGGERWFVQYSPYAYFNEHLIAINDKHIPMHVGEDTIVKLLDFVDYFPNYFIGSNASLPIIGGSILDHEHFQGGGHLMPMQYAGIKKSFSFAECPDVKCGIVDWYCNAIRIEGESRESVYKVVTVVVRGWKDYSDENLGIRCRTNGVSHNSVAPVARKVGNKYVLEIILRNNLTSERYPDGIFHAHPEYHNVKKEAIGLIESMGLFILPARLKRQLEEVAKIICGQSEWKYDDVCQPSHDLYSHRFMIEQLIGEGVDKDVESARSRVREKVNLICRNILKNTAVFKEDVDGENGFDKFIKSMGFEL